MDQKQKQNNTEIRENALHLSVGVLGAALFLYSVYSLQFSNLGTNFLIIAVLTLGFGSRISLKIESLKSTISTVDVFIFLILLLFGANAAVCLLAIDTYITSCRFTKRIDYRFFNVGTLSMSIFFSVKVSQFLFGNALDFKDGITQPLLIAFVTVVLLNYLFNSAAMALSHALRTNRSIFEVWKEYYVWTVFGFLACGSVALVAANAIQTSGILAFVLMLPIIGIIYFSYYSQQGKLQAITEKVEQSEKFLSEITESEERFRSAFSNAPIGMALISSEGKWLQTNQSLCHILGYKDEDFENKQFRDFLHPDDLYSFNSNIGLILHGEKSSYHAELRYNNSDGNAVWTQTSISSTNDAKDSRLICQIQDITARRKAEEKLRHDAFYDSLTDLANRNMLVQRLNKAIAKVEEFGEKQFAVLFVDLDRFKLINDSIGHSIGDRLLVAVSQRLKKCLPSNSILARLGSDEFFILLEADQLDVSIVEELVNEIQTQINLDFGILGHQINVTASIGIVFYEPIHKTAEDLLRDADAALHLAKTAKGSKFVFFDQTMREKATNQMQLEKDLKKAVDRNELFVVYQPILELENKSLAGFEALVRWNHPNIGLVSPVEFISLAEESGAIVQVGHFVLHETCRQIREWQTHFQTEFLFSVSVNVSAKQLLQRKFFGNVIDTLEKHDIKPHQIKLEITESVVVENNEIVTSLLRQFRALGVKLSMDDFGTGYSSLSYLHQLPINTLKIDRSFISQMETDKSSAEIVKTINLLAHNLSLDVVAEGIETEEQLNALREIKCGYGQGYLFAKPLMPDSARAFIENSLNERNAEFLQEPNAIQPFQPPIQL